MSRRMVIEERLYEMRLLRERVPSEFLPLFDHLLRLARDDLKHGRPQSAGRRIAKATRLASRAHSSYYDPETSYGHRANRRVSAAIQSGRFSYLSRDRSRRAQRGRRR